MKLQDDKTESNISYVTPEIREKQEWLRILNALTQAAVGVTFLIGIITLRYSSVLDDLKNEQIMQIYNSQTQSRKK